MNDFIGLNTAVHGNPLKPFWEPRKGGGGSPGIKNFLVVFLIIVIFLFGMNEIVIQVEDAGVVEKRPTQTEYFKGGL